MAFTDTEEIIEVATSFVANRPGFTNRDLIFRTWAEGYSLKHNASTSTRPSFLGYHMTRALIESSEVEEASGYPDICREWVAYQLLHDRRGNNIEHWREWYESIMPSSMHWLPKNPYDLLPKKKQHEGYLHFAAFGFLVRDTALNYIAALSLIDRLNNRVVELDEFFIDRLLNHLLPDLIFHDHILLNSTPVFKRKREKSEVFEKRRADTIRGRIFTVLSNIINGSPAYPVSLGTLTSQFRSYYKYYPSSPEKEQTRKAVIHANKMLDDAGILID